MKSPLKIAVTGAAGQIGYALIFRIASGEMFGVDRPIALHLIEIPNALGALDGVVMELHDCAFPLLQSVVPTADLDEGFRDVNWALLVGSIPRKAGVEITRMTNMTIWGNHSATQYPDFYNAKIDNHPANEVIADEKWLKEEFISSVQQRGAAVIKARGLSSAGSAANAIIDTVRFLTNDTPRDDWHSVAVCSDGSYDVEKGLISSFPVRVRGGKWEIVQNVPINEFSRAKIDASVAELKEEGSMVKELLG